MPMLINCGKPRIVMAVLLVAAICLGACSPRGAGDAGPVPPVKIEDPDTHTGTGLGTDGEAFPPLGDSSTIFVFCPQDYKQKVEDEIASRWRGVQVRDERYTRGFNLLPTWGVNTLGVFDLASLGYVAERSTVLEFMELDEKAVRDSVEAEGACFWAKQVGEAHVVMVVGKSFTLAWSVVKPHLPPERPDTAQTNSQLRIPDFEKNSQDSDGDGLPDYYEKGTIGTDACSADTDGDGLSDYMEVCKYRTDPRAPDSDADGKPDGDWDERREFTYTIWVHRKIEPPWNTVEMNDHFQDVRILSESEAYLEYEVVVYPEAVQPLIPRSVKGLEYPPEVGQFLAAGFFTNYDAGMKEEFSADRARFASDVGLLEYLASRIFKQTRMDEKNQPVNFLISARDGGIDIIWREPFDYMKSSPGETDQAVLDRQAFGRQMWEGKIHGTCGSSAVLAATVYRAAGLPARIVALTPSIDYHHSRGQMKLLQGVKRPDYWLELLSPAVSLSHSFANHFINEVFVGGQWIRVNVSRPRFGPMCMGMSIREHAFADFSQADYAGTWGDLYAGPGGEGRASPNPYGALAMSDQEPIHEPLSPGK